MKKMFRGNVDKAGAAPMTVDPAFDRNPSRARGGSLSHRRMLFEAMEPRILLSGDLNPVANPFDEDQTLSDSSTDQATVQTLDTTSAPLVEMSMTPLGDSAIVIDAGTTTELNDQTLQGDLIVRGNVTLNNITTTHAITLDGGTLTLINCTISNTTIGQTSAGGAATAASFNNTLDNVTLDTDLIVDGGISVTNGFVLNGNLSLGGVTGDAIVGFNGTQTVTGNGQIIFAGDYSCLGVNSSINNFDFTNPSVLTIGSGITLHIIGSLVDIFGATLVNQGTIIVDTYRGDHDISLESLVNDGSISAVNGANFTINNLTNHSGHTVSIAGGGFLYLNAMNNEGTISADSSTMEMSDGWGNSGVLSATNSTVNFGGTFRLSDVGTFNRSGGTVNLTGVLNNTGTTLLVDTAFSGGFALSYGTIKGGVVDASDANYVMDTSSGTLDNVTLNTDLAVNKLYGYLTITNGITLNGILTLSGSNSHLYFEGNQVIDGTGKVLLSGGGCSLNIQDSSTLTVSSGITIQATCYTSKYISASSATLINQGTIIADAPGGSFLYINTSSLVNDGVILAVSGANLAIQNLTNQAGRTISIHGGGTLTLTTVNNSGTISADSSILNINSGWMNNGVLSASNTTVNFGGAFKLSDIGTFTRQGGTVNLTGTLDNTGSTLLVDSAFQGGVNLAGGTIKGGVIDATDANYVLRSTRGTLDNVTLNTDLVVADYKVLVVTNGLTLNAKLTLATSDYAYLKFNGSQSLNCSASVGNGHSSCLH